eukprot:8250672-Pyramimonas_sp.AAC.1
MSGAQGISKMIESVPMWASFKNSHEAIDLTSKIQTAQSLVQGDTFLAMFVSMNAATVKDA